MAQIAEHPSFVSKFPLFVIHSFGAKFKYLGGRSAYSPCELSNCISAQDLSGAENRTPSLETQERRPKAGAGGGGKVPKGEDLEGSQRLVHNLPQVSLAQADPGVPSLSACSLPGHVEATEAGESCRGHAGGWAIGEAQWALGWWEL